jgi:hypothetical protein
LLKIGIDWPVLGKDFQVNRILHIKIHKPALATDAGLQGNTFFDPVVLPDNHD